MEHYNFWQFCIRLTMKLFRNLQEIFMKYINDFLIDEEDDQISNEQNVGIIHSISTSVFLTNR